MVSVVVFVGGRNGGPALDVRILARAEHGLGVGWSPRADDQVAFDDLDGCHAAILPDASFGA